MVDEREIQAVPEALLVLEVEVAGRVIRVLESCHSLWMFDTARQRFCRAPRGARLDGSLVEREWTPYYHLDVNPATGGFAVALNEAGTRRLRSWIHGGQCSHCRHSTVELILDVPADVD